MKRRCSALLCVMLLFTMHLMPTAQAVGTSLLENVDFLSFGKEGGVRETQEGCPSPAQITRTQNFKKVLSSAPACQKDFFDTLAPTSQAVGASASSAILVDRDSGRVLYEKNADDRRLIASVTKLMTALVALESGVPLDRELEVPREVVGVEGSSLYLKEGERITLEALLYGLMLQSGNDAAAAVAICCGGSVERFVERMNDKAAELGMTDSHFENPSGLNGAEHYSTARDLAVLAKACLDNEKLAEIVSTKTIRVGNRSLQNHNKLLWSCPGCIGLKTGYTEKAGRTLVSAAVRGENTLIAVTLNAPDDWRDHTALYDWGFGQFDWVEVCRQGTAMGRLPVNGSLIPFADVAAAEDFSYPVGTDEPLRLTLHWTAAALTAPVEQGREVGCLRVWLEEELVGEIPLVCRGAVQNNVSPRKGLFDLRLGGR